VFIHGTGVGVVGSQGVPEVPPYLHQQVAELAPGASTFWMHLDPMNPFQDTYLTEESRGEPARDLLMRVLDEVDSQRLIIGVRMLRVRKKSVGYPNHNHQRSGVGKTREVHPWRRLVIADPVKKQM